jgi:hypothetical protein
MTLVLGYASHTFIVMAADHQITPRRGTDDDECTKLVLVGDTLVLGFTGLAEVGSPSAVTNTAEWIAKYQSERSTFATGELGAALSHVVLATPWGPKERRLELLIAGFDAQKAAFVALVSNFRDSAGTMMSTASDNFTTVTQTLTGEGSLLGWVGTTIPPVVAGSLKDRFDRISRLGPSPEAISEIFAGAIVATAAQNQLVNELVQIAVLPSPSSGQAARFDSVTPRARPGYRVVLDSPWMVMNGAVVHLPAQEAKLARPRAEKAAPCKGLIHPRQIRSGSARIVLHKAESLRPSPTADHYFPFCPVCQWQGEAKPTPDAALAAARRHVSEFNPPGESR